MTTAENTARLLRRSYELMADEAIGFVIVVSDDSDPLVTEGIFPDEMSAAVYASERHDPDGITTRVLPLMPRDE